MTRVNTVWLALIRILHYDDPRPPPFTPEMSTATAFGIPFCVTLRVQGLKIGIVFNTGHDVNSNSFRVIHEVRVMFGDEWFLLRKEVCRTMVEASVYIKPPYVKTTIPTPSLIIVISPIFGDNAYSATVPPTLTLSSTTFSAMLELIMFADLTTSFFNLSLPFAQ